MDFRDHYIFVRKFPFNKLEIWVQPKRSLRCSNISRVVRNPEILGLLNSAQISESPFL